MKCRIVLAAALLSLAGCSFHDTPPGLTEVSQQSGCVTCHREEYLATSQPPHQNMFPETCENCHLNTDWRPALEGGHPEARFQIQSGPHGGARCLDCHDLATMLPSAMGQNTHCIDCHGEHDESQANGQHRNIPGYAFTSSMPNFCLTCHPNGRAGMHPEAKFPTTGPHDMPCADCHNYQLGPSTGGGNVDCIGCHTGEHSLKRMNEKHQGVGGYNPDPNMPHFCTNAACHPRGQHD
jgi:hypothetical protein